MNEINLKFMEIIADLKKNMEVCERYDFLKNHSKTYEIDNYIIFDENDQEKNNIKIVSDYKNKEGKTCVFPSFKQNEDNLKKMITIFNKHGLLKITEDNSCYYFNNFRINININ